MRRAAAPAKINLALVVGPLRDDGKHEVTTVLQRIDLVDRVSIRPAEALRVTGFRDDTLVRRTLELLAEEAGVEPRWAVKIDKEIPVGGGLGGGSSDAATALRLANETLDEPLARGRLVELASSLGSDVPFFLGAGPQLGEGDGSALSPLELPQDFWVVVVMPWAGRKASTAAVYEEFDRRGGAESYGERRSQLLDALGRVRRSRDLAVLPANDLAASPLTHDLASAGAFRADVTGAGPAVYGLFARRRTAAEACRQLRSRGRVWLTVPAWYG